MKSALQLPAHRPRNVTLAPSQRRSARLQAVLPAATATQTSDAAITYGRIQGTGPLRSGSSSGLAALGPQHLGGVQNLERPPAMRLDFMPGPVDIHASSGADFVDLIPTSPAEATSRLQDAMTYRMLGCDAGVLRRNSDGPSAPGAARTFNVKQLKGFRDNVTRNLAPSVALGFAAHSLQARTTRAARSHAVALLEADAVGFYDSRPMRPLSWTSGRAAEGVTSSSSLCLLEWSMGQGLVVAAAASASGAAGNEAAAASISSGVIGATTAGPQNPHFRALGSLPSAPSAEAGYHCSSGIAVPDPEAAPQAPLPPPGPPAHQPTAERAPRAHCPDTASLSAPSGAAGRISRRRQGSRAGLLEGAGRRGTTGAAGAAWL